MLIMNHLGIRITKLTNLTKRELVELTSQSSSQFGCPSTWSDLGEVYRCAKYLANLMYIMKLKVGEYKNDNRFGYANEFSKHFAQHT